MASEDASILICTKQALPQGHRFGPMSGRLRVWDAEEPVKYGSWKIFPRTEDEKVYNLTTGDRELPQWLYLIKQTSDEQKSNMILVGPSGPTRAFYFEMTKDVPMGAEYALMGRRTTVAPPEVEKDNERAPAETKIRRARRKITPEERLARKEMKRKLMESLCRPSRQERRRRCVVCGQTFKSPDLFMSHRRRCGTLKEDDLLTSSDESEYSNEELEEGEEDQVEAETLKEFPPAEGLAGAISTEPVQSQLAEDVANLIANITSEEVHGNPDGVQGESEVPAKRPRGRPRKDGLPPIARVKPGWVKRKKRRKRRRYLEDGDHVPLKLHNDCIPTPIDPARYPFACETCDNVFPTKTWFDFHREQYTEPGLTYLVCNLCDTAFRYLAEHTWHMETVHELEKRELVLSEKFRCDTCKKAFRSPIHLEQHRRKAAAEEPLPKGPVQIKCKFCEKSFSMETSLENHSVKHHPEYLRFQCTENNCLLTFKSKEERASHLELLHMTDSKRIYKCPVEVCTKSYTSMLALNDHYEMRHVSESCPFVCEICGKSWTKIGKLRLHYRTHSTKKEELCDICGRAYKTRAELRDHHTESHTDGEIRLQCRFCPSVYSRRSSRSYHEKRHRNSFPFTCPKPGCNKRFIAVIDYKRHLIHHTGVKLYRCRYCSTCFTRRDYLQGHEKKHELGGEILQPGRTVDETVTIKVPWPMDKPVKINGKNMVVYIESDMNLAEDQMTETLQSGATMITTINRSEQVMTSGAPDTSSSMDILQEATAQVIQPGQLVDQPIQLLPFTCDGSTYTHGDSASAAMQDAVYRAMSAQQQGSTTHQILMPNGDVSTGTFIHGGDGMIQTDDSEQAALMLQQLVESGAQVVFEHDAHDPTTIQTTMEDENGDRRIVLVNIGPDMMIADAETTPHAAIHEHFIHEIQPDTTEQVILVEGTQYPDQVPGIAMPTENGEAIEMILVDKATEDGYPTEVPAIGSGVILEESIIEEVTPDVPSREVEDGIIDGGISVEGRTAEGIVEQVIIEESIALSQEISYVERIVSDEISNLEVLQQ